MRARLYREISSMKLKIVINCQVAQVSHHPFHKPSQSSDTSSSSVCGDGPISVSKSSLSDEMGLKSGDNKSLISRQQSVRLVRNRSFSSASYCV